MVDFFIEICFWVLEAFLALLAREQVWEARKVQIGQICGYIPLFGLGDT